MIFDCTNLAAHKNFLEVKSDENLFNLTVESLKQLSRLSLSESYHSVVVGLYEHDMAV